MTRPRASDSGVTLIELVVAIAIGSMIVGAVTAALLSALVNYDSSATRLAESNDAQLLSAWFLPDVQSAGPTVDTAPATGAGCSGALSAGSTNVLAMSWMDSDGSATYAAAYRLESNDSRGSSLVRYFCSPAGSGASRVVVGHSVQSAAATVAGQTVKLAVTSCAYTFRSTTSTVAPSTTTTGAACYTYTLSGTRRTPVSRSSTTTPGATTTSSSTTTTTIPCHLTSDAVNPLSDQLQGSHLKSSVAVSVDTSGSCAGISISFNTGTGSQSVPLGGGPSAWSTTIDKNAYSWTAGSHPFTVSGGSTSAGVANPIPFTVTP